MTKDETLARIEAQRVVALIRADGPGSLIDCARALSAGGLDAVELTMTTPGAIGVLREATAQLPGVLFGLGTVLDARSAEAGVEAGARFIVTPGLRPEVVRAGHAAGVPVLSGALTPTEVAAAMDLGAEVIKIFPAEFFGPAYLKALRAVFPSARFMPTGGVTPATLGDFLRAGAFAAAAGSALVEPAALRARDWPAITARAAEFARAAKA